MDDNKIYEYCSRLFIYKIALVGKNYKKYGEGVHRNVDVFVVLEENNYNLEKYSVGGITKSNSKKVDDKQGSKNY
ncbi:hypothetical protein ACVXZY_13780 [Staphylococcus aureus]